MGFDARPNLVALAQGIAGEQWEELERKPKYEVKTQERQRPENVKERIVKERGYKNIRTVSEQVAEMDYRPGKCQKTYRMVVLRKNLTVERGEVALFDDIRYFFYITNDTTMSPAEVVYFANDRCDHENDIEQLKNGVKALRMPVGRSGLELGVHGDRGLGVEPEGVGGIMDAQQGAGEADCPHGV